MLKEEHRFTGLFPVGTPVFVSPCWSGLAGRRRGDRLKIHVVVASEGALASHLIVVFGHGSPNTMPHWVSPKFEGKSEVVLVPFLLSHLLLKCLVGESDKGTVGNQQIHVGLADRQDMIKRRVHFQLLGTSTSAAKGRTGAFED